MRPVLDRAFLPCVLLAILGGCAADHRDASVSGTWAGYVKDVCPQCESWINLDLHETSAGNVTGVYGDHTSGHIDFFTSAAFIQGRRSGDSISLIATMPCDSTWRATTLAFRGRISRGGDSLTGEFSYWYSATISGRIPIALLRAPIDSSILTELRSLRVECNAAA